jgi:hypothetical protein
MLVQRPFLSIHTHGRMNILLRYSKIEVGNSERGMATWYLLQYNVMSSPLWTHILMCNSVVEEY